MSEMTAIYQFMLRMASFYDMAIVLNHHTRKKPSSVHGEKVKFTQDDVIGSSAGIRLANAVYIISVEEREAGHSVQTVKNVKSWDKKVPPFTYEFIEDDNGNTDFRIGFDTEENNMMWSAQERLKEYIHSLAAGAFITVQDASMYLHLHEDTVRLQLERFASGKNLSKSKLLEKVNLMGKLVYRVL